jgi:pimeloyl-ACP methyl ester carboxylesterase
VFDQIRGDFAEASKTVTEEELDRFKIMTECMNGFDFTEGLEKIKCPVFVIGDRDDRVFGPDSSELIAEHLDSRPDFELYMYDGYGHAVYDTAPDCKEKILGFLKQ